MKKLAKLVSVLLSVTLLTLFCGDSSERFVHAAPGVTYEVDSSIHNVRNLMDQFGYIIFKDLTTHGHQHANVMVGEFIGQEGSEIGNNSECTIRNELRSKGESFTNFIRTIRYVDRELKFGYQKDELIVGSQYTLRKNGNENYINGKKVDSSGTVRQETATKQYIDLDNLQKSFAKYSRQLAGMDPSVTVNRKRGSNSNVDVNLTDMNKLKITVKQTSGMAVVNLKADDLSYFEEHTLIVDYTGSSNKAGILINVDLKGKSSFTALSLSVSYNGKTKALGEKAYGSDDNRIYWNFYDSSKSDKQFSGTISVNGDFDGTIIAPYATLKTINGINGTAVANKAEIKGESHRINAYNLVPPADTDADFEIEKKFSDKYLENLSESDRNLLLEQTKFGLYDSTGKTLLAGPVSLSWDKKKKVAYAIFDDYECSPDGKGNEFYFKLKETKSPAGYALNGLSYDCKVQRDSNTKELVTYYKKEGASSSEYTKQRPVLQNDPILLSISKVTGEGDAKKVLTDAKLELTYLGSGNLTGIAWNNDFGGTVTISGKKITWSSTYNELELKYLPVGKYTLKEVDVPAGYLKASDLSLEIKNNGDLYVGGTKADGKSVEVKDAAITVEIQKLDSESRPVAGATLKLEYIGSDSNVDLRKVSAQQTNPANTWINQGLATEMYWFTGEGKMVLTALPVGEYRLTETNPPKGYKAADAIEFEVTSDGKVKGATSNVITMVDEELKPVINIYKSFVDKDGKQIALGNQSGAVFALFKTYNGNGECADQIGTKEAVKDATSGKYLVQFDEGIQVENSYYFKEIKAPDGFEASTGVWQCYVDWTGKVSCWNVYGSEYQVDSETGYLICTNKEVTATVTFSKEETGLAGKEIPGAKITLSSATGADLSKASRKSGPEIKYDSESNTISWTSGDEPLILEGLRVGEYVMSEIAAPSGYAVATDITFKVSGEGKLVPVSAKAGAVKPEEGLVLMTDDAIKATVTFSKEETGLAGKEIPGAKITLKTTTGADLSKASRKSGPEMKYDSESNTISWTSGSEPLILEGLRVGEYVMSEIAAPSGYAVATDITFTVENDGKIKATGVSAAAVDRKSNV
ncbi:MAG: choice-of-anchor A family protein [Acetatifactor sp.]|nr:choice-of-anchor A family protein [Acetatifactor sp.]